MSPQRFVLPALISTALTALSGLAFGQVPLMPEGGSGASADTSQPANTLLSAKRADHAFTVIVEPSRPEEGKIAVLRLQLATIPENPDPTFGDRVPVRNASLIAVLTSPGSSEPTRRQTLHPYGGAGSYGMNWIPNKTGLWKLSFEMRDASLPAVSFQIGVGVDTPPQVDESLGRGLGGPTRILGGLERGQRGGAVVGPLTPASAAPTASSIMNDFSIPASTLTGALFESANQGAAKEAISVLLAEARKIPGTAPRAHSGSAEEYNKLGAQLVSRLEGLASAIESGEMAQARAQWRSILDQTCAQCHAKFWWGITPDLSSWPTVQTTP